VLGKFPLLPGGRLGKLGGLQMAESEAHAGFVCPPLPQPPRPPCAPRLPKSAPGGAADQRGSGHRRRPSPWAGSRDRGQGEVWGVKTTLGAVCAVMGAAPAPAPAQGPLERALALLPRGEAGVCFFPGERISGSVFKGGCPAVCD
jgi:hypothetical protein